MLSASIFVPQIEAYEAKQEADYLLARYQEIGSEISKYRVLLRVTTQGLLRAILLTRMGALWLEAEAIESKVYA